MPVASKTGTGEVYGKQSTSWFASYAPADKPRYAVVMMVSQGGTGSGTSGPAVAEVYKTLFGISGQKVDLAKAHPPGGRPADRAARDPARRHHRAAGLARCATRQPRLPPYRREDGP